MTLLVLVSLVAVGAAQGLGKQIKKKIKTAREVISREINFKDLR